MLVVPSGEGAEGSPPERALRRHVESRDDLELRSMSRLAALAAQEDDAAPGAEEAAVEAQRRMAQAEEAFSQFDYAAATTQLREALELLRPSATRATGRQRLADAHLQLALVLLVHGEREAALDELRTCVHVDPECAPDPARHPPELVAAAREAAQAADARAQLRVTTDPPGARVSLDGAAGGATPHAWDDVSPGRHYVSIERDGFLPEVHLVAVAAGEPTSRRFVLTAGPPSVRAEAAMRDLSLRGTEAEARWRAEAADLSEADVLVVLRREAPRLRLGAFDGRGAALGEALDVTEAEADVQRFLDEVLPPPVVPFYGQWWFWTPVAAAVAIGLATATFLLVNTPSVRLVGGPTNPAGR